MSQTSDLILFARLVESGSFSEVARQLRMTKSTVSKHLSRLEDTLGVRLMNRSTRRLSLTEVGREILPHAERIREDVRCLEDKVAGLSSEPAGLLRLSAPVAFGNLRLSTLVAEFQALYPRVAVELNLNDRRVDLAEEGFDAALRLTANPPEAWHARRLAAIRYWVCATPGYWQQHGRPREPRDLLNYNCLRPRVGNEREAFQFERKGQTGFSLDLRGKLIISTSEGLRGALLQGSGFAVLPDYAVDEDLASRRLEAVLPNWRVQGPFGDSLYLLYLSNRYLAPKLRVFIDYLVEALEPAGSGYTPAA